MAEINDNGTKVKGLWNRTEDDDLVYSKDKEQKKQRNLDQNLYESVDGKTKGTKYELVYFNFRGRAELCRLIFATAGIEFVDTRIMPSDMNEWVQFKKNLPFGQLPILKINDEVQICQSHSIARYLAAKFDLNGDDELKHVKCDMVVDCVIDMMDPIQPCFREKDNDKKIEMRERYEELLPDFMAQMENLLKMNDNGSGYFVGEQLTWADLAVMNAWHWIPGFGVLPKLHQYPLLEAHRERTEAHPKVKEWLETRPISPV